MVWLIWQYHVSQAILHRQNAATVVQLVMERGLVCPQKAQEFDQLHKAPKFGRNNKGAKELANGYTRGKEQEWGEGHLVTTGLLFCVNPNLLAS